MTIENENPTAQGTIAQDGQTPVAIPAPQSVPVVAQENAGFQQRINELVAQGHAFQRQAQENQRLAQEAQQANQMLLMRLATQATPQVPAVPQVEIDPEQRKIMDAYFLPQKQALEAQQAQFAAQAMLMQAQALTAGQDPRVAARTMAIAHDVISRGDHLRGFSAQQALTYAYGELAPTLLAEAKTGVVQTQVVAQGAAFNGAAQQLTGQSVVTPVATPKTQQAPDMNDDPDGAAEYYAKRLGNTPF